MTAVQLFTLFAPRVCVLVICGQYNAATTVLMKCPGQCMLQQPGKLLRATNCGVALCLLSFGVPAWHTASFTCFHTGSGWIRVGCPERAACSCPPPDGTMWPRWRARCWRRATGCCPTSTLPSSTATPTAALSRGPCSLAGPLVSLSGNFHRSATKCTVLLLPEVCLRDWTTLPDRFGAGCARRQQHALRQRAVDDGRRAAGVAHTICEPDERARLLPPGRLVRLLQRQGHRCQRKRHLGPSAGAHFCPAAAVALLMCAACNLQPF